MKIREYYATQRAREHMLDKHSVEWWEVCDIMEQDLPMRRSHGGPGPERRYMVQGYTSGGRRVRVILALEAIGVARVITAYQR